MKKYRIIMAIVFASVVFIISSLVYFLDYKRTTERSLAEIEVKYWKISSMQNETMYRNAMLREAYQNQLIAQDIELPKAVIDSVSNSCFILRLTESFCMSCHEKSIQLINDHFSKKKAPDLLILGSFTSDYSFKNELSYLKSAKESINIPNLNLSPIDNINTPYIFNIDSSGKIQRFCFLLKGEEETLNKFLHEVAVRE